MGPMGACRAEPSWRGARVGQLPPMYRRRRARTAAEAPVGSRRDRTHQKTSGLAPRRAPCSLARSLLRRAPERARGGAMLLLQTGALIAALAGAPIPVERASAPTEGPRFADVRLATGVRLRYAESGDPTAPPLILLHGYSDSWFSW